MPDAFCTLCTRYCTLCTPWEPKPPTQTPVIARGGVFWHTGLCAAGVVYVEILSCVRPRPRWGIAKFSTCFMPHTVHCLHTHCTLLCTVYTVCGQCAQCEKFARPWFILGCSARVGYCRFFCFVHHLLRTVHSVHTVHTVHTAHCGHTPKSKPEYRTRGIARGTRAPSSCAMRR